jgi:hypothetical protein
MTGHKPVVRDRHPLYIAILILFLPAITNATLYEVDTESSSGLYCISGGGECYDLTVSGYFETEIANNQLSFVSNGVTFMMGDYPRVSSRIFPSYPATLTGQNFEGRLVVCDGYMPDFWYRGEVHDDSIVFDGVSHYPVCGNDVNFYTYHIVARQFQPRDIPQLQLPGILLFVILICTIGYLFISRGYSC